MSVSLCKTMLLKNYKNQSNILNGDRDMYVCTGYLKLK